MLKTGRTSAMLSSLSIITSVTVMYCEDDNAIFSIYHYNIHWQMEIEMESG